MIDLFIFYWILIGSCRIPFTQGTVRFLLKSESIDRHRHRGALGRVTVLL